MVGGYCDVKTIVEFLNEKSLNVEGVFITHAHFDYIYGLPELVKHYPHCKVYVTEYAKEGLASDKLNMSRYHETPVTFEGENVVVVHEGISIRLFNNEPSIKFYEPPGHNPGCLTIVLGDMVFTGDAYIPGGWCEYTVAPCQQGTGTTVFGKNIEIGRRPKERLSIQDTKCD